MRFKGNVIYLALLFCFELRGRGFGYRDGAANKGMKTANKNMSSANNGMGTANKNMDSANKQ
ncbi:hypothetical protein [Gottfriedia acidiceleris]|uniref:hypothetical protein n=1 Tax=Gottfriedia acidiceleris TaxID=371036 RepID=UPI002FFDC1FA